MSGRASERHYLERKRNIRQPTWSRNQPCTIRTFRPPNTAVSTLFCARAFLYQRQRRTLGDYGVLWRAIGGIGRTAPGEDHNYVYFVALYIRVRELTGNHWYYNGFRSTRFHHVFLRTRLYSAGTLSLAALYSATNSAFASGRQFVQASMILRQPAVFSGIYVAIGGNSDVGR